LDAGAPDRTLIPPLCELRRSCAPQNSRAPVDVAALTGMRTMLDYFLAPVFDVMEKSMRER
jgi:hypothetical protein